MNNLKDKFWIQLIVIYTRYLLGGAFVFASLIKIKGQRFTALSGETAPIHSAWHFFETMYQSGPYWIFLGLGQLIAGFFLMTQRYSKLGALVNLPIIANIFVITLSYDFAFTPVIVTAMLLANLCLIFWEWGELKILINLPYVPNIVNIKNNRLWEIVGYVLFAFTFIYRLFVDNYNILLWFSISLSIGIIGLFLGIKQYKKQMQKALET